MSFWKGLSRAMESNEAQRNVEQQREDRLASEAKAEAFRDKQWSNQLSQQAKANSRADKAWDRDESRYQVGQGRLDKADDAAAASAKAAAEKARTEWEFKLSEADYSKSRDVVADLRVAREENAKSVQQMFDNDVTQHGIRIANANRVRNDKQFENTVKQQGVTNAQWDESQKFKVKVFSAGEARANKVFEYSKERHDVADVAAAYARETAAAQVEYDKTRDEVGDKKAKQAFDQRLVEYGNTLKRQGVSDDQWTQVQAFKIDQANFANNLSTSEFEYKKERHGVEDIAAAIALEVEAAEREHKKSREGVSDAQFQQNLDIKLADFKNKLERQGVSDEQWKQAFDRQGEQQTLAQDNVMFGRKIKMLEVTESMTKAFSGKGGSTKGAKAPSAEDMNAATINIRSELGGKQGIDNLGKADKEFFETIMGDPAAAHGIYAFVQTQRVKEGNNINILDLPKYINLAGMIEAKGDPEAAERLRSEILGGDPNIDNIDSLIKGVKALKEYKPAEVVWGVLKAPKKSQDHSADLKLFSDAIQNRAMSSFNNMDKSDPSYDLLKNAIDELDSDKPIVKSRGFDTLFDIMGVELLEEMGMQDNPAFSYKLREYKAREAALRQERMIRLQETSKGPEVPLMPSLGEESSGMPDRSVQEFTREEAESFMGANPDFRGQLRVDGQLMSNEGDGPSMTAPEGLGGPEQDALPEVPAEVKEAIETVVAQGTEAEVEQATSEIAAEYGEDMAATLFDDAKSARGTGKSAAMDGLQTPYTAPAEVKEEGYVPPTMGAAELNTPAVREAVANVPAEVKEAVETVITQGTEEEVEQAKQEIADEFGEEVAAILFDYLKSARGTGKSAVMDGLQ